MDIPNGFKIVCERCGEDPSCCEECGAPFCVDEGESAASDDALFCSFDCFDNAGFFMCVSGGNVHYQDDASMEDCFECNADICTECNSGEFRHCVVCDVYYCDDDCFQNGDSCEQPNNMKPQVVSTNSTGLHSVHSKMVNGKEQCFCNDSEMSGLGHLPGGLMCRIY